VTSLRNHVNIIPTIQNTAHVIANASLDSNWRTLPLKAPSELQLQHSGMFVQTVLGVFWHQLAQVHDWLPVHATHPGMDDHEVDGLCRHQPAHDEVPDVGSLLGVELSPLGPPPVQWQQSPSDDWETEGTYWHQLAHLQAVAPVHPVHEGMYCHEAERLCWHQSAQPLATEELNITTRLLELVPFFAVRLSRGTITEEFAVQALTKKIAKQKRAPRKFFKKKYSYTL